MNFDCCFAYFKAKLTNISSSCVSIWQLYTSFPISLINSIVVLSYVGLQLPTEHDKGDIIHHTKSTWYWKCQETNWSQTFRIIMISRYHNSKIMIYFFFYHYFSTFMKLQGCFLIKVLFFGAWLESCRLIVARRIMWERKTIQKKQKNPEKSAS